MNTLNSLLELLRYFWKVDLIDTIKKSAADPPKALKAFNSQRDLCDEFSNLKGQRVLLKGKYDHSKGMHTLLKAAFVFFSLYTLTVDCPPVHRGVSGRTISASRIHRRPSPGDG